MTDADIGDFITSIEKRLTEIETQLEKLKKQKKSGRKSFTEEVKLDELKIEFIESNPYNRTDLNDWELVLWASLILSKTKRREILNSRAEIAKRSHKLKEVIKYFADKYNTADAMDKGRNDTKDYLEYILTQVPHFTSKQGEKTPMTFYVAISTWAVNNYASKMLIWRKEKTLDKYDKPME